jgi:molybdopterin-guanine dinucleotide biosynthesis adapter protein
VAPGRRLAAAAGVPVLAVSGPSGVGKTRLLRRLIPALAARGLRVAVLKHTRHAHRLDVPGKDTDLLRRAGAVAAAIAGPGGVAWFGPPEASLEALVHLLPPVDLVLVEGFRAARIPRIEVHRRSVSRRFLCAGDPDVFAVVGDAPPPRPLPLLRPGEVARLAELVCRRLELGRRRLRGGGGVRSLSAGRGERASAPRRVEMPKTSARRVKGHTARRSRSDAGRKGGRATLRARGPEFFSRIGRKGGKARSRRAAALRRAGRAEVARPRPRGAATSSRRGHARAR